MRIAEEKIEEIRRSADVVDIISGYVQLKKHGKNFFGVCPFHQEKTPSFSVSPDKQIFHCFGCHAGGNVFRFLMDYKSISFVEAVQEVGEIVGIPINQDANYNPEEQSEQEKAYDLNVLAAKYFSNNLFTSTEGEVARKYLEERKIKTQTQKIFGLGMALFGWDNFFNYSKENNADLDLARALGLIDKSESGKFYDKFRGRLMFPIFSPNGRVIAFGGRVLNPEDKIAKYLNSPESLIYQKRRSLYGLFHSKDEIRKLDKAILVEGYMDLISLFQNGVKNVVASSGTALTDEQAELLSRFTKNVVVLFDADIAGQKAAMRSIEILLKKDFDVKIMSLPEKEDPDSFIIKYGKEEFDKKLQTAKHFLEYQAERFEAEGKFQDSATYAEAVRELVKTTALVNDQLKRNLLLKTIAKRFHLRERLLETELEKFIKSTSQKEEFRQRANLSKREVAEAESKKISPQNLPMEKEIIKLLFEGDPQILNMIFQNITYDDLSDPIFKQLYVIVYDEYENDNYSPADIIEKIDDENLKTYVMQLVLSEDAISRRWEEIGDLRDPKNVLLKTAGDTIKRFRLKRIDAIINQINGELKNYSDESLIMENLKEIKKLQEEKKLILNEE